MTTCKKLIDELARVSTVLAKQASLRISEEIITKNKAAMANAIVLKIASIKDLTSGDEAQLYDAVAMCPCFDDVQKTKLSEATSALVLKSLTSVGTGTSTARQDCENFPTAYFTAQDWAVFDSSKTMNLKINTLVHRVVDKLECRYIEETNFRSLANCIVHEDVDAMQFLDAVRNIKHAVVLARRKTPAKFPQQLLYPEHPQMLGDERYTYAYDEDDPPFSALSA